MTNKLVWVAVLAAVVMLAPVAAAEADDGKDPPQGEPGRPDDAAWVDDCPEDMLCAAGTDAHDGRDPDCVDCVYSHAPVDDGNGTTWGTDCPPGVYCMADGAQDGVSDGDAGWVDCDGEVCAYDDGAGTDTRDDGAAKVEAAGPSLALFGFLGGVGLVGLAFVTALRRA